MEGQPSDNYEERLYSVFKSFDVNNEESLDKSAVHNLCDALQLEERGAALVDTLFEARTGRVTFSQFRSGLLAVLGDGPSTADPAGTGPPSDDDSSGREVAPRFIFGSKKYGRRSRPQPGAPVVATTEPRASSASRLTGSPPARPRTRRSASAMEAREAPLEHDARVDRERALALCRDLRMDAIDARLVDRVFDEAHAPDTTVGEFFERLNATLATSVEEAKTSPRVESGAHPSIGSALDNDEHDYYSIVTADAVIEAWETAGIRRPRRLLAELGFTGASVPTGELERALDEEQRAAPAVCPVAVTAVLALARMRAARATERAARLVAERDKLRGDVVAGERRAFLLAQEVDESHARLEAELRATLRRADTRHAEETRRAAREAAAEAERAAGERARLEGELTRRDEVEAGLRAEVAAAAARLVAEETRALAAEEARAAAVRDRAELATAVREAEARAARAAADAAAAATLTARLEEAVRENVQLRERVEELAAELAAPRATDHPAPVPPAAAATAGSLCLELEEAQAVPTDGAVAPAGVEGAPSSLEGDDEKRKLIEIVSELESSLEAMRSEYESCEEYWSGKLREERAAHDADAAAAGARLADLTARVADFERRLRPPPPSLPPIAEQAALEAQVTALEAELAAARRAPPPAAAPRRPPAPGCARCGRTAARADAAVRRLAARLAAADLLVKDLYVENCELALRRASASTAALSPL